MSYIVFVMRIINRKNKILQTYLDIRQVGTVFNCPRLLEAVDRFIRKNFTEFIGTQAFYELSEDELVQYLDHNHLRYV